MTARKRNWIVGISLFAVVAAAGLAIAASIAASRIEPYARQAAIHYLSQRFASDVDLRALRVRLPQASLLRLLLTRGRGISARIEGEGLSMKLEEPARRRSPLHHPDISLRGRRGFAYFILPHMSPKSLWTEWRFKFPRVASARNRHSLPAPRRKTQRVRRLPPPAPAS